MTDTNKLKDFRHRSSVYDSMVKSPNRAMLRATGMTDDSFEKPIVGVISTWAENTPCNMHLHDFGKLAKEGVKMQVPGLSNTVPSPLQTESPWEHLACASP